MRPRALRLACLCFAALAFEPACSRSNNLLLGRVEAAVGTHTVVVTDCYRTSVPPPRRLPDTAQGRPAWQFMPCHDADVLLRGEDLFVNGRPYGHLAPYEGVLVDHGVVSVLRQPRSAQ